MAITDMLGGDAGVSIVISAVDNFSKSFKEVNKTMVATGAAITAFGIAGIAAFATTIPGARDLAEETSKLNTVFNDINKQELADTITELGNAYILSNKEATRLVASTGDLLTGLGFTDDIALEFSKDVVALGSDLASFNNFQGGAAGAAKILEKALLGERESLKSLGISILESDVKNQLLIDGTSKLTGLALKQARANATLTLIYAQTQSAQGDVARTSQDLANRQREMKKEIENAADSIGTLLLPAALKLTNAAISLIELFSGLSDKQKKWIVIIGVGASALALILGPLLILVALLPALSAGVGILSGAFALLTAPVLIIIGIIAALILTGYLLYKHWDVVTEKAKQFGVGLKNVFIGIRNILMSVWNGIMSYYEKDINNMINMINTLIRGMNKIPGMNIGEIGNISSGFLKGEQMAYEKYTPLTQQQTSAQNVTNIEINNLNGFNARDIANQLQDELNKKI